MDERRLIVLEQQVEQIQKRNERVEADKAWETSWVRILSIAVITYMDSHIYI